MAQSIKLGSDTYLDWSGVTVDSSGTKLSAKTKNIQRLVNEQSVPTTETQYSANWQDYDLLIVSVGNYNNVRSTIVVTKDYFATTGSGARVIITNDQGDITYEVHSNYGTSGKIYIKATSVQANQYISVWAVRLGL